MQGDTKINLIRCRKARSVLLFLRQDMLENGRGAVKSGLPAHC